MLLSDKSIKKLLNEKKLLIKPAPLLKSASVRLHLSNQFAKPGSKVKIKEEYVLKPKGFILGSTLEHITMPNDYAGLYDGSTTLAREGIMSHVGSMLISPGSSGNLTLEIFNASDKPFLLKSNMRIGQLIIMKMDSPTEKPQPKLSKYTGKQHKGLVTSNKNLIYRPYK